MDAFLTSTLLVALAEIGDKTQLLSFVLAARLRRPWAIVAGIFVATLANHALAGSLGAWIASLLSPNVLRWSVGILFIAFGLWTLKPDTLDDDDTPTSHGGAFVTTLIAFFIAEMGDKTQFATVALAARFDALAAVVTGTTVGMLLANVPAVLIGEKLAKKLPLDWIRRLAALVFILTGGATLLTTGA
jgi:putative Ca2+/H+ antiporter (TMEM165/GDT1 family)